MENSKSFCEKILVYFPIIVLPIFAGGARPWLWSGVAGIFGLIFALSLLVSKDFLSIKDSVREVKKPLFLLLPILAYPFVQIIPLPLPVISLLSPQRALWLQRSMEATAVSRWGASLSYMPLDTFMSGLWILTLALFAFVLHRSMREGIVGLGNLLTLLFVIAGLESLYGIFQVLGTSTGSVAFDGAHGTFVNRDHYAAFLGMIWPLQLVWLWRLAAKNNKDPLSFYEKESRRKSREKQFFFIFLTGIVLLGLIFSGSRGGIISLGIGTTVLAYLGRRRSRSIVPILIGCWVIILAYGSVIGFEGILKRFAEIEHDAPARFTIWQFTRQLIRDHWLTGTGAGTYQPVIFLYQVFDTDLLQVGAAHCDYLQIASEWGLPFSLLIFCLVWGYWWATAVGAAKKSAGEQRSLESDDKLIRIGALAGSAAFLSHIWVDFNWQIPANQLYFVIVLVLMSWKGAWSMKRGARSRKREAENQDSRSR
jgi:hypothetical protein